MIDLFIIFLMEFFILDFIVCINVCEVLSEDKLFEFVYLVCILCVEIICRWDLELLSFLEIHVFVCVLGLYVWVCFEDWGYFL